MQITNRTRVGATIQSDPWPICWQCPPSFSKGCGQRLAPCCSDSRLPARREPAALEGCSVLSGMTVTLLPLFPTRSPRFQGSAVGRHLQPWGRTKRLIFHYLLEIWLQILYWSKGGTAPLASMGFMLQQQRIWHFIEIWLPGFHEALVLRGLCVEFSLIINFQR